MFIFLVTFAGKSDCTLGHKLLSERTVSNNFALEQMNAAYISLLRRTQTLKMVISVNT